MNVKRLKALFKNADDLPDDFQGLPQVIGFNATLKVMSYFENSSIYFPVFRDLVNAAIKRDWAAMKKKRESNIPHKLGRKYDRSERSIYRTVGQVKTAIRIDWAAMKGRGETGLAQKLAAEYDLPESQIHKIVNDRENQLEMFD